MESADRLEKVEMIRERTGLNYAAAADLLDEADGDVLRALILHEQRSGSSKDNPQWQAWEEKGNEVLDRIKELIKKGNVTRLIVKREGNVLAEIPVTAGVIGAVIAPYVALLGTAACLFGRCSIEVQRRGEPAARFDVAFPDRNEDDN